MKNRLLLIFLLLTNFAFAQRNSISIGYGYGTTDQIISGFATALAAGFTDAKSANVKSTGAIALSYHHFNESNRAGLGFAVVYDNIRSDIQNKSGSKISTSKSTVITAAAEGKVKYNKGENFNIYGLLGAGYTFTNTTDPPPSSGEKTKKDGHFNFQITPIGLQFGGNVKVFAEVGFGYKGLANGGIQFNF